MKQKFYSLNQKQKIERYFPFFLFEMTCTFILNKTPVRVVILKVDCLVCFGLCTSLHLKHNFKNQFDENPGFFFLRSNKEIGSMFGERSVPPMLSCGVSVIKTGSILIDTLSNISMKYCSNTHFFLCYCCIMTRHFYRYFSGLGECKLSRYLFQKICHVFFYIKMSWFSFTGMYANYYFVLFLELHVI